MPTYLYYTQGILDFQEETATYSEERLEIRLKRKKHRCPKCGSKDVTLRALYERDVRGLPMGRLREVHFIYTLHQVYCHRCHERSIEQVPFISHPKARLSNVSGALQETLILWALIVYEHHLSFRKYPSLTTTGSRIYMT